MKLYPTIVLLVNFCTEAANIKAYFPPANNSTFPRLRLETTIPDLRELTFCSWVKTHKLSDLHLAPVLSYAIPRHSNEFLVLLYNRNGNATIEVNRGPNHVNMDCPFNCRIGIWCHICVSWFGSNGRVHTFVNGNKCKEAFLSFKEPYIPGGGMLVIGQEQDGMDNYYDLNQAWIGDIADVQLWDEVLSEDQVKESGVCKGKRKEGNVVSWLKTPMVALDGIVLSATQLCLP